MCACGEDDDDDDEPHLDGEGHEGLLHLGEEAVVHIRPGRGTVAVGGLRWVGGGGGNVGVRVGMRANTQTHSLRAN